MYCLRILSCCSKRHYNSQDKCGFNKKLSYLVIASCSVCNFLTLIVDCSPPINDKVCNYINYPHFASKESKTSALNSCNLSKGFMQIKAGSISSIVTSQYGINYVSQHTLRNGISKANCPHYRPNSISSFKINHRTMTTCNTNFRSSTDLASALYNGSRLLLHASAIMDHQSLLLERG